MYKRLKLKQAFITVFPREEWLSRASFFVLVPFMASLLLTLTGYANNSPLLFFLLTAAVVVINIGYQLYLWMTQFFYAQQIMEGEWDDYLLTLQELFTDWETKLKLLWLRFYWYLPLLLVAAVFSFFFLQANPLDTLQGLDVDALVNRVLSGPWFTGILALGIVYAISQLLVEQVLVQTSNFVYAQSGSVVSAMNPVVVLKLVASAVGQFLVAIFLSLIPTMLLTVLLVPLAIIIQIPFLGSLFLGLVTGVQIIYNTLFMGNIYGQIWQQLEPTYNKISPNN